jgi:hypothetical protein
MKAQAKSRPLTFRDAMHIKTAQCWLSMGELSHAGEEMRKVRRSSCTHPDFVKLRYTFLRTLHGW